MELLISDEALFWLLFTILMLGCLVIGGIWADHQDRKQDQQQRVSRHRQF